MINHFLISSRIETAGIFLICDSKIINVMNHGFNNAMTVRVFPSNEEGDRTHF